MFWSKNGHFSKFFFLAIWTKKCLSWVLKQEVSKGRKIDIFLKGLTHGFGPKMAIFQLFFLGNREKENDIYDILERKNAFLAYKNKKFKKLENWHFPKGDTHGFGPKIATVPTFFFLQYRPGKCLLWFSRTEKNNFLG